MKKAMAHIVAILSIAACVAPATAQTKMQASPAPTTNRYLVTGEFIDGLAPTTPEAFKPFYDRTIAPSLQMLAKWESDGKIRGGILVAERKGTFIVDAASNAAVDQMIQSLPFWNFLKWTVTPLVPFDVRLSQDRQMMQHMGGPSGGGR